MNECYICGNETEKNICEECIEFLNQDIEECFDDKDNDFWDDEDLNDS